MKLLTLNLNYYGAQHGPWEARRSLIVEVLRAERPDIVALQAVARQPEVEGGLDQAAQLARALPEYDAVFRAASRDEDGREEGLAFLSRFAVLETRVQLLSLQPGLEDSFKRILLHGRFDAPQEELHVFCAHFSWVEAQALDNVNEALPQLGWVEGPAAMLGDFNQTPDSAALRLLTGAGWTDAWSRARPGEEGFTFVEGGLLSKRIDYALLNAQLAPRLQSAQVVAHEGGAVRASDHAGLLVTLAPSQA